jgi:hypothetical protein
MYGGIGSGILEWRGEEELMYPGNVLEYMSGVEKEEVMYAWSVLEYMSGVKKRKSCMPGVFWGT